MTISELIKQLEVVRENHGSDLEIVHSRACGTDTDGLEELSTQGIDLFSSRVDGYVNGGDEKRVMIW